MAEKRPNIHPFFIMKKNKSTKSTEDAESITGSPTSINDSKETNDEEVRNECLDSSVIIIDDELRNDESTSSIDIQVEEHLSECRLICCTSSTVYVPTDMFELQLTLGKDKRSCQAAWFTTYSWLTFCKVRCCKRKMSHFINNFF